MRSIGFPDSICPAALTWVLEHMVSTFASPVGGTMQRQVHDGDRWRCTLQAPPLRGYGGGLLAAYLDEISRGDRFMYLSPAHSRARGLWLPDELVTNGDFANDTTDDWTPLAGTSIGVNGRRLKVQNTGAAAGHAQQAIVTEANKPHVLIADLYEGSVNDLQVDIRINGGALLESLPFTQGRIALMFYPTTASTLLQLGVGTSVANDYVYYGNISACRCLTVNGTDQTGTELMVENGPISTDRALSVGEFVTVQAGDRWQLVRLKEDFDTDSSGAGTLRFEPALTGSPPDGFPVIVHKPFSRFVLATPQNAEAITPGGGGEVIRGITFDAIEDLTVIAGEIQLSS